VPLSAPARALLGRIREEQDAKLSEFVFPSASSAAGHLVEIKKSWAALTRAAGISDLRLHDLRHSYASALVSSGASLPLIGAMLGHASPATTARYSHMFADPQRAAAEKIGALIENAAVPPAPDKAVPLAKGRGRS
jgi:site-specific recombinase XerD